MGAAAAAIMKRDKGGRQGSSGSERRVEKGQRFESRDRGRGRGQPRPDPFGPPKSTGRDHAGIGGWETRQKGRQGSTGSEAAIMTGDKAWRQGSRGRREGSRAGAAKVAIMKEDKEGWRGSESSNHEGKPGWETRQLTLSVQQTIATKNKNN